MFCGLALHLHKLLRFYALIAVFLLQYDYIIVLQLYDLIISLLHSVFIPFSSATSVKFYFFNLIHPGA